MKKIKLITVMIMVTTLLLCSCTQYSSDIKTSKTKSSKNTVSSCTQHPSETKASKNTDAYNIFTEDYNNISKKFHMDNFKEIGEGELQHSCVAFTKLKNFSEKNDMIDENIMNPVKRKLYYYNSKEKMLIYITHIYMKESMEMHLLTSDYPYEEIESDYNLKVPVYSETYMCYRHTLVNLKVYSLDNNKSKLVSTGIKALKEYDSIIKR